MEKVPLWMVRPANKRISWKNQLVLGVTQVGQIGYVVEDPNNGSLVYIPRQEYIYADPIPENELENLRKKVYQYEIMITKLLAYPDLMIIAAVKNELDHMRNGDYENKRE